MMCIFVERSSRSFSWSFNSRTDVMYSRCHTHANGSIDKGTSDLYMNFCARWTRACRLFMRECIRIIKYSCC